MSPADPACRRERLAPGASTPLTIAAALRRPDIDPLDARVLLQHVLGVPHAYLIAHGERALTVDEARAFSLLYGRRAQGEPVAYLVGQREFYGRTYAVTPAVLIPRPETEGVVERALACCARARAPRILDLGTGSGCIAITLALERPDASVVAVDASTASLALARGNAERLGATNVRFACGPWFAPLDHACFDLIAANPPYVADADPHLRRGDVRFEPRAALAAGPTGLEDLAHIVASAGRHLTPGGWLVLEHGWDQAEALAGLLARAGFDQGFLDRDLAGHPRVSGGRRSMLDRPDDRE